MTTTFKPGPNQQKFFANLRSGQYAQGTRKLKDGSSFCCLGIACVSVGRIFTSHDTCEGRDLSLPDSVQEALGFKHAEGSAFDDDNRRLGNMSGYPSCTCMNDRDKKSFSEIADFLEANIGYYFTGPK